jgi:hypothetical protein
MQFNAPLPHIPYYSTSMVTETHIYFLTTALTLLLPPLLAIYIHYDYKAFLSLGPGGTPATPLGYLKIKLLSLLCLRDPLRAIPVPPHFRPQTGYFNDDALAPRKGERPLVANRPRKATQPSTNSSLRVFSRLPKTRGTAWWNAHRVSKRTAPASSPRSPSHALAAAKSATPTPLTAPCT